MTEQEKEEFLAIQKDRDDAWMAMDAIRMERDDLRKKLDEEKRYQDYCIKNSLKGYASGHMTRCIGMFTIEHGVAEDVEKTRTALRKLANNPAIALDVRNDLDKASWYMMMYLYYRKEYYELRDTNEKLKQIDFRKKMAKKKAGD